MCVCCAKCKNVAHTDLSQRLRVNLHKVFVEHVHVKNWSVHLHWWHQGSPIVPSVSGCKFWFGLCLLLFLEANPFRLLLFPCPDHALRRIHTPSRSAGTIGDTGLPRLLDMGQCNDSYSAVAVALALAEALGCSVGELPLSFAISWLEQKAVAVLLTMLHLGLKPIYLGPELPAFVTPAVLDVLVKDFGVRPVGNAKADIQAMIQGE